MTYPSGIDGILSLDEEAVFIKPVSEMDGDELHKLDTFYFTMASEMMDAARNAREAGDMKANHRMMMMGLHCLAHCTDLRQKQINQLMVTTTEAQEQKADLTDDDHRELGRTLIKMVASSLEDSHYGSEQG